MIPNKHFPDLIRDGNWPLGMTMHNKKPTRDPIPSERIVV
jgi:hypothetical protein